MDQAGRSVTIEPRHVHTAAAVALECLDVSFANARLEGEPIKQLGLPAVRKTILAYFNRSIEEDQALGEGKVGVDAEDEFNAAIDGLIGDTRKKVAIADDELAPLRAGQDPRVRGIDVLTSVCGIEEGNGSGMRTSLQRQDGPQETAYNTVGRLARRRVRGAHLSQAFRQKTHLGRRAGSVQPFQYNEISEYSG